MSHIYKPGDSIIVKAFMHETYNVLCPCYRYVNWDHKTTLQTKLLSYDWNENADQITSEIVIEIQWYNEAYVIGCALKIDGWKIVDDPITYLTPYIGKYACWARYSDILGLAKKDPDGEFCLHCHEFSHMSEPNHVKGFLCYGCRSTYGWMYQ